ncbi:glutamine synthetase, partial [Sarracenia purpurea var. burkii]
SRITALTKDNGEVCTDFKELTAHIVSYYQQLLGTEPPTVSGMMEDIQYAVRNKLSAESVEKMGKDVTEAEIKD